MSEEIIKAVERVDGKISKSFDRVEKAFGQDVANLDGGRFNQVLERKEIQDTTAAAQTQKHHASEERVSIFEQVRQDHLAERTQRKKSNTLNTLAIPGRQDVDRKSLLAAIDTTVDKIQRAKEGLSLPNARVPNSSRFLLRNRLSEVNNDIKSAFQQVGAPYENTPREGGFTNPVHKFLGMLGKGQEQLQNLGQHIARVAGKDGGNLSPGAMIRLQYRMHKIQHQIEIFTALLNKGLESVKTIMSMQI